MSPEPSWSVCREAKLERRRLEKKLCEQIRLFTKLCEFTQQSILQSLRLAWLLVFRHATVGHRLEEMDLIMKIVKDILINSPVALKELSKFFQKMKKDYLEEFKVLAHVLHNEVGICEKYLLDILKNCEDSDFENVKHSLFSKIKRSCNKGEFDAILGNHRVTYFK